MLFRIYDGLINWTFLIIITFILGLSIRIIRVLTPLEDMPNYKHLFYSILFFPGFAFLLVYIFPIFKIIEIKKKHIIFVFSLGLLVFVAFIMGFLSIPIS
jgi:hypothetical protein